MAAQVTRLNVERPEPQEVLLMKSPMSQRQISTPSQPMKIHEKSIDEVILEFNSSAKDGLSQGQAAENLLRDGPNELEKPPRITLCTLFLVQLNSVIMYLLMGAVVASAVIKATGDEADEFLSYIDSIAITIIVLINATSECCPTP
jgi:Ca2+-transporting ATPase